MALRTLNPPRRLSKERIRQKAGNGNRKSFRGGQLRRTQDIPQPVMKVHATYEFVGKTPAEHDLGHSRRVAPTQFGLLIFVKSHAACRREPGKRFIRRPQFACERGQQTICQKAGCENKVKLRPVP